MYVKFSDEEINNLYISKDWDKFFKINTKDLQRNLGTMCQDLDEHFDSTIFVDIKTRAYKRMNDYTHTGANQIAHNFNEEMGRIEPNFETDLIINTLQGNYALMRSFTILYFEIGLGQGNITDKDIVNFQENT